MPDLQHSLVTHDCLHTALEMYRDQRATKDGYVDTSIVGKVHMSIAKILERHADSKGTGGKEKDLEEAVRHMQDGLRLFRKCVGVVHPLTANALGSIGKVTKHSFMMWNGFSDCLIILVGVD